MLWAVTVYGPPGLRNRTTYRPSEFVRVPVVVLVRVSVLDRLLSGVQDAASDVAGRHLSPAGASGDQEDEGREPDG
jgi:hypothetical protein